MTIEAPKIDQRTFADIVRQILGDPETKGLRDYYTPGWTSTSSDDPGVVMVNLFARLMDIIIERLNKVPDKNFVYFLDMLGVERLPGNPARAPVTFTLPEGSTTGGEVPEKTQVATVQTEEAQAIIFETEKSMFATPVKLQKVFSINPSKDKYEDQTQIATGSKTGQFRVFGGDPTNDPLLDHILYLAHDQLFAFKESVRLILTLQMKDDLSLEPHLSSIDNWNVEWERFVKEGEEYKPNEIPPFSDETDRLTKSGAITFYNFLGTEKTTQSMQAKGGGEAHWIRCRLVKSIPARFSTLPKIDTIKAKVRIARRDLDPDLAFFNNISIDLSKDFYPFGEAPKFNDTFYLASDEVFSKANAKIGINVNLSKSKKPGPSRDLKLKWEYWDGQSWKQLTLTSDSTNKFPHKFTHNGDISFICPVMTAVEVNGQLSHWIRVRIVAGNYGLEAHYVKTDRDFEFVKSTLAPPSIATLKLNYRLNIPEMGDGVDVQKCLTYNDFTYTDRTTEVQTPNNNNAFPPFTWVEDTEPALYLGFDKAFGDKSISIYFALVEKLSLSDEGGAESNSDEKTPLIVAWEYSGSSGKWARLEAEDGTMNFTTRGTVTFIGPSDFTKTSKFGHNLFWLRARLDSGTYDSPPQLKGVHLNTTWASNIMTIKNELVGSSTGERDQSFRLSRTPVLKGQIISVKELEMPSEEEKTIIEKEEKDRLRVEEGREMTEEEKEGLVKLIKNEVTGEDEIWVRWHKVDNFLSSNSKSRHYVLDRIEGEISFGDDENGMIPPVGKDNIKAEFYQAGGGSRANRVAIENAIKELKTSLPYIDKAYNVDGAAGGSDAERMEETKNRGPQTIKHRDRAITTEDFVWLARQASTQIALAKCLPTTNKKLAFEPGSVAVIIVPESDEPKPLPSQELTHQVQNYLTERGLSTVVQRIYVLGPGYKEVSVIAEVAPKDRNQASVIEGRIVKNLQNFLHPLKGGPECKGWEFGRSVYISEIYSVIEGTEGVDYVKSVILNDDPSLEEVPVDKNSLVFSGVHDIKMI